MKNLARTTAWAVAVILLALSLPFLTGAQAFGQEEDEATPGEARQEEKPPNRNNDGDLIRRLNLTVEQIAQIRRIREENAEEWRATRQRLVRAQRALDEAIYADEADEAAIEHRARELATAQTAVNRLRAFTELRIRRVLTAEQLKQLRQIRVEAMRLQRERRQRERRENALQESQRPGRPAINDRRPGLLPPVRRPTGRGRRP